MKTFFFPEVFGANLGLTVDEAHWHWAPMPTPVPTSVLDFNTHLRWLASGSSRVPGKLAGTTDEWTVEQTGPLPRNHKKQN